MRLLPKNEYLKPLELITSKGITLTLKHPYKYNSSVIEGIKKKHDRYRLAIYVNNMMFVVRNGIVEEMPRTIIQNVSKLKR